MVIKKNQANIIVLTLTEKCTQPNHDFLFEFTNEQSGEIKYCYAPDLSNWPLRYNEFTITDSVTEIPSAGQLNFTPVGSWSYKVHEMPQSSPPSSPPSLDPADSLKVVETGSLFVYGEDSVTEFDSDENKSKAVFEE